MLVKLGNVEFSVTDFEGMQRQNEITDRPIEGGSATDNIDLKPDLVNLEGYITGDDAWNKLQELIQNMKRRNLLKYVGRNAVSYVAIESLNTDHVIKNGFAFNITLKQVRLTKSVQIQVPPVAPAVSPQVKPTTNRGRQQLQPIKDRGIATRVAISPNEELSAV